MNRRQSGAPESQQPSRARRVGRPPSSGPEAESNPLHALTTDERKDLFLQAAAELFERKGVHTTSISDITERLGLSKAIFYYYWNNKQELIEEIHNRAISELNRAMDEVLKQHLPADRRLQEAMSRHLRAVMEHNAICSVMLDNTNYSEETLATQRAYNRRFEHLIRQCIEAGAVRDDDPKLMTFAILGLLNSVARWYHPQHGASPEQIIDLFIHLAANGYRIQGAAEATGL